MGAKLQCISRRSDIKYKNSSQNEKKISFFFCLAPSADPEDVLKRANAAIQEKYEFFETTLQIERFQEDMDDCKQCVVPLK